ncbi:MAG: ankyrin repeat domain-containing protein [Rickettsiaceae bacterium]|nr:ankyrin repeat domain-containing protein [Rickettsiaceae bacterium]
MSKETPTFFNRLINIFKRPEEVTKQVAVTTPPAIDENIIPTPKTIEGFSTKDSDGKTYLHHLARDGSLELLKSIESKIPEEKLYELLSITDNQGRTAAHIAAKYKNADIVKQFIEYDPELLFKKDNHGCTMKDYAYSVLKNTHNEEEAKETRARINERLDNPYLQTMLNTVRNKKAGLKITESNTIIPRQNTPTTETRHK